MSTQDIPQNSILIITGTEIVPLKKRVVNIGRNSTNDIRIDNPHISRYHAQLRAHERAYHLIDLNSTCGSQVNGKRITQIQLYPGDVISLGGVPMVFSQTGLKSQEKIIVDPERSTKEFDTPTKEIQASVDQDSIAIFLSNLDTEKEPGPGIDPD